MTEELRAELMRKEAILTGAYAAFMGARLLEMGIPALVKTTDLCGKRYAITVSIKECEEVKP
jgi:hypothetical protein